MALTDSELLAALKKVREDGPTKPWLGICGQIKGQIVHTVCVALRPAFKTWPKFSGDVHHPIPADELHATPEDAYEARRKYEANQWDRATEYGRLRWELLDHCIDYLEQKAQRKRESAKQLYAARKANQTSGSLP